jgi:hypothetical protein
MLVDPAYAEGCGRRPSVDPHACSQVCAQPEAGGRGRRSWWWLTSQGRRVQLGRVRAAGQAAGSWQLASLVCGRPPLLPLQVSLLGPKSLMGEVALLAAFEKPSRQQAMRHEVRAAPCMLPPAASKPLTELAAGRCPRPCQPQRPHCGRRRRPASSRAGVAGGADRHVLLRRAGLGARAPLPARRHRRHPPAGRQQGGLLGRTAADGRRAEGADGGARRAGGGRSRQRG